MPAGWIVALFLAASPWAQAHDNEEFWEDREDPYAGPGYRAGDGGAAPISFDADGLQLMSWIPLVEFLPWIVSGDDCWGYTSPSGREYALIGLSHVTAVVEVTDPGNAQLRSLILGPTSTWRDIKVFGHFAYAVSEGGSGIQVIDMGNIDNGPATLVNTVTSGGGTSATHNVAINEESGYLYRIGGGGYPYKGLRIYDLSDPVNPTYVGSWHGRYVHDAQIVTYHEGPFAGKEVAFCCANDTSGGGNPSVYILDVTNKSNITVISSINMRLPPILSHPSSFSHQGWLSPDRHYFYYGDEADEAGGYPTTTRVIDVFDLTSPTKVSYFSNGNSARDHNIYTVGNLIYEANYRSGLRVYDATDPLNPTQIAYFDTYPGSDSASYNGLWNVYPYFASGTIVGSDMEKGLFVWRLGNAPAQTPLPAEAPHDVPKNRYISFNPDNEQAGAALNVAYRVELTEGIGETGVVGWVGQPYDPSCQNDDGSPNGESCQGVDTLARVVDEPVFRGWLEDLIHLGDCEIVPAAVYHIAGTTDGIGFSEPLELATIAKPGALFHGDVVGALSEGEFTPPQGVVNITDVQACLFSMQVLNGAPHRSWTDVTGLGSGAPPNFLINVSDLQQILKGLAGETYLESNAGMNMNPSDCP